MIKKHLGFTLIEALAVIAVMGLMASIILVNTNNSRKKGHDTAVKSALREVRNVASLMYHDALSYEGVCKQNEKTLSKNGDFGRIKEYIEEHYGENGTIGCKESDEGYAVISSLNSGDCWCIDYQGISKEVVLDPDKECDDMLLTVDCP